MDGIQIKSFEWDCTLETNLVNFSNMNLTNVSTWIGLQIYTSLLIPWGFKLPPVFRIICSMQTMQNKIKVLKRESRYRTLTQETDLRRTCNPICALNV